MTVPAINEEIVRNRRKRADALRQIIRTCRDLGRKLEALNGALRHLEGLEAPEIRDAGTDLSQLSRELSDLERRVEIRHERFQSGLITVSIAGLEKAGKTTFLRSLTGIDALPAFDERCTAVCCELHYAEDRSDFDIAFYTGAEFAERVLKPVFETIAGGLPEPLRAACVPPASSAEFVNMPLPPADALPGGTTAFKLLSDLRTLQAHFRECRVNLDHPPLLRRPLAELREWVSYGQARVDAADENRRARHLARVAAAKICRIYTRFRGGSPHLRWIDTPGVDDPNRRARELTLAAIAEETDLLVVASRPGATPSPNENFHNFWDSVSRQPDEIDLMNRMLFVLNCDRRVDPDGENIQIHRKYLTDAGVPRHLFVGPLEAVRPEDAAILMEKVNDHLGAHLSDQDDQAVLAFRNRLRNIQARIRLFHDTLADARPSDAGLHDLETEAFHKWFHWYGGGRDTGFWTELVAALDRATREIPEDARIRESETTLNAIFAQEAEALESRIPSPEALEDYVVQHRGENPVPGGMRTLSIFFSDLVNRLASEVQEFGPIMQDKLLRVLSDAGLAPLMAGEDTAEKLASLLAHLDGTESPVIEVLRETLELPRNLKYVIRYELRPAVDFCDPTLWNPGEDAWNRLREMVAANGGPADRLAMFEICKYPPVSDSRERDHENLRKIAGNAILAVQAALSNERYLPRRIADDFMRDCRVRLCFSPESEQEWRTLLFRNRGRLLAGTIGQIRARSERIRAFHQALNALTDGLP
ncbi:Uncharacterized protein DENIS_3792 [Desulfonema ishimotonii]|uniref:Dynamin family protein n=2 Tax=Desulfonema ishimotonii TaxID=45657 RepID=A0A401G0R6_9BACT|nr:Uncharacterized protein DENIS_3792 [Desulfonema ishimotonii]